MKKGPYEVISSKTIYSNPWITVNEDRVIGPDKKEGMFGTVDYGRGVSIVALNDKNEIYLVKKYMYVLEAYGIETPSGAVDERESILDAAKRELFEEVGLKSEDWEEIGIVQPFTMIIKSPAYLFLARNISQHQYEKDEKEGLSIIKMPFDQAYDMVLKSEIFHAQSCVAILRTKELLEKK